MAQDNRHGGISLSRKTWGLILMTMALSIIAIAISSFPVAPSALALESADTDLESTLKAQSSGEAYYRDVAVLAEYKNGGTTLARIGDNSLLSTDSDGEHCTAYETAIGDKTVDGYVEKCNTVRSRGSLKNVIFCGHTPMAIYIMKEDVGPWVISSDSEDARRYGMTSLPIARNIPYVWEGGKAEAQPILLDAYNLMEIQSSAAQIVEMPAAVREWFVRHWSDYDAVTYQEDSVVYSRDGRARAWTAFLADAYYCDYDAKKLGEIYATDAYDAKLCEEAIAPLVNTLREIDRGPRYEEYYSNEHQDGEAFARLFSPYEKFNVIVGWRKVRMTAAEDKFNVVHGEVKGVADKRYTGKPITFKNLKVYLGFLLSENGVDYTVSYRNNKNVGKATITIKGKGCWVGTKEVSFRILPKANKASVKKTKLKKTLAKKHVAKKARSIVLPGVTSKFGKARWKVVVADKRKALSLRGGKVIVRKGAGKGAYTIKVRAEVPKGKTYEAARTKVVAVKVTVK